MLNYWAGQISFVLKLRRICLKLWYVLTALADMVGMHSHEVITMKAMLVATLGTASLFAKGR